MSVSVVIPALNEIEALPRTLPHLLRDDGLDECIVVDGGSSDGTRDFVRSLSDPRVELLVSSPGRGRQMNAGAQRAGGECLLFNHADTLLPDHASRLVRAACADPRVRWGGFRHRFSDRNWKLALVSALHNLRCRMSGVVYGDQSMFVRRDFFRAVGGFPEEGLEDLVFSDRALLLARSHLLDAEVETDSRKFRQLGEFRALAHVVSIIVRYERARAVGNEAFFRPYR